MFTGNFQKYVKFDNVQIVVSGMNLIVNARLPSNTGGADKSLARPRRKQATATEDFEFHISYL
jgi:hypothetical protein